MDSHYNLYPMDRSDRILSGGKHELVQKVIMDEIKSIQGERKRPKPDYVYPEKRKSADEYYREVEDYLDGKDRREFRTIKDLSFGTDVFFKSKQVINEQLLVDFLNDCDLTTVQFFTNNRNYHNDRLDKLKIFRFYEENIHKLRRKFDKMMVDDMNYMKSYLEEAIKNVVTSTQSIFNEYLNIYQRRINAEYLKVLNDEKYNVYDNETKFILERIARKESNDFLKYKPFFPDFIKLIDFVNKNVELKKRFMQQNFKFNTLDEVSLSDYLDLMNKNVEEFVHFSKEMMDEYKLKEIDKASHSQYIKNLKANKGGMMDSLDKSVYFADEARAEKEKKFGQSILALPADDETIFEIGDTTKLAEPYWKINQLILQKFIETTHSTTETINDFLLTDKDRYAISCSNDRSIRITNLITGDNRLAIPYTHKEGSKSVLMLNKGLLASGGHDGEIKLFDPNVGQSAGILMGHANTIWKMVEMAGEALVTCSEDHTVKFWNLELMNCYKTLVSPQNKPIRTVMKFNETKIMFASTRIWLYNIHRDDIEKTFTGHTGYIKALAYDKKYNRLISGSEDDTLRFWSMDSCQLLKVFNCNETRCMEIWQDEYLVTGHSSFEIKFWDLGLTRLICKKRTRVFVDSIHITTDGRIVYPEYNQLVILKNPAI